MKKLLITSTDMMMIQFLVPHVKYLSENGFHVELACSEVGARMDDVRNALGDVAKAIHTVRLERSPANPRNFLGYRDMRRLLAENQYDIIWTNEPVMGVVTRLAARDLRKSGTRVVYMCHGFHFFKGASLLNWLVFYPIERFMSRFCDCIVTINHEDEARAKTFHCPRVEYIHGIGIDTKRLTCQTSRSQMRQSLGLTDQDIMILSVGELQTRKNHEVILRALAKLDAAQVKYFICGRGVLQEHLQDLARELNITDKVLFLGYRLDIPDIMNAADIYAHPSRREGLGLACLEAMYFGLPLVTSNVQGIPDYNENGVTGFLCAPDDVDAFSDHMLMLIHDESLRYRIGRANQQNVDKFTLKQVQPDILNIMSEYILDNKEYVHE